jgi:outer membrane immunogenic protein
MFVHTKVSLSLIALAALGLGVSQSASAADLPVKAAPVAVAPPPTWTGFYIGGHVGAGWGTADTQLNSLTNSVFGPVVGAPLPAAAASNSGSGFLGGVQAGYNYQMGPWVFGIEGDWTWTDISSNSPCGTGFLLGMSCSGQVNWTADLTGRVGVTIDKALVYIKGGAAWADVDHTITNTAVAPFGFSSTVSDTRFGWLLGFGTEYAVNRNWSVKAEYNFMDFGNESYTFTAPGVLIGGPLGSLTFGNTTVTEKLHVLKVGANYRF